MLNQVIIVGRVVRDLEVRSTSDGKKVTNVTVAVTRNYKNSQTGKYDADFFTCTLWENLAVATANYCKKGSIIGLRGHLSNKMIELENGKKYNTLELIAENVTFISNNSNKESVDTTTKEISF